MKSYFFVLATALSGVLALAAIAGAVTGVGNRVAWIAAAVANLPLPAFYAWLKLRQPVRTSENLPLLILLSAGGSVVAAWESYMQGVAEWQPVVVALVGTALLLLYVFWYSRFGRVPNARLEIRSRLPEFEVKDLDGSLVRSSQFLGKPAINLFYRGNWDSFCVAQLQEIAGRHTDLERLGIQLNLISAQPADEARKLAGKLGARLRFFVDDGARVAGALDIAERHALPPGTAAAYPAVGAMPTVVVTSATGTILFADQTDNYRVRPEPDIYISILKRTGAVAR